MSLIRVERIRSWLRLASLLRHAGPAALIPTVVLALLSGLLPTVFIIAMAGIMLNLTTGHGGTDMSATIARTGADLAVAFGALLLQQVVPPFQDALTALVGRRIDQHTLDDLLSTTLHGSLDRVESERAVGAVTEVRDAFLRSAPTPGVAAAVLPRLAGRYLQLICAIVLVSVTTSWYVGILLLVGAIIIRFGQRGALDTFTADWGRLGPDRRRMAYLAAFGTEPNAAKEIRVLGMLDWLHHRYGAASTAYLTAMWARRRATFFRPFLVYTAIGFIAAVTAFAVLARIYRPVDGVVVLAVAVQAVLVPLRFGVHFSECDVQTQYGLQNQALIDDYHDAVGRPARMSLAGASAPAVPGPLVAGAAHRISFADVRFRYGDSSHEVLRGLDLTLEPGRSTALVGVNGAGKTTMVKLLAGSYAPTAGVVSVDGHDLTGLDASLWCREVAVILQNFTRFDLSLRENLLLGAIHRPEDRDAMMDALVRANAYDIFTELPNGLDTVLSPAYVGGTGLSGGQWQRVALARAFYAVNQGASVLVLDEPTAQLDVRAEIDFYDRFLEMTDGLTTLVISHRFSTVRRADAIAVLENGRIAEFGSHDRLLAEPGSYASMFRTQADRFADAANASGSDR